jgi:hypothetical protein
LQWIDGLCSNITKSNDRGAASILYDEQKMKNICIIKWPDLLLKGAKSQSGAFFGTSLL